MAPRLDHTIVGSRDPQASAEFLTRILGLAPPGRFGPFVTVETANGVSLDYDERSEVRPQHYAFLVEDEDFPGIFGRVEAEGIPYYADPSHSRPGINTRDGGQGFYFSDPDGHNLEVLTRRYGSGAGA